jgi:hypothetical protein
MISPSLTKRAVNPREIAKPFGAILRSARESAVYPGVHPTFGGVIDGDRLLRTPRIPAVCSNRTSLRDLSCARSNAFSVVSLAFSEAMRAKSPSADFRPWRRS